MENENNGEGVSEANEKPKTKNKKIKLIIYAVIVAVVCFVVWSLISSVSNTLSKKDLPEDIAELDLPSPKQFERMSDEEKAEAEKEMTKTFAVREVIINEAPKIENPEIMYSGDFIGADSYKGKGEAKIQGNGGSIYFLRFEKFEVTPGPALHVLLSPNESPTDSGSLGDYVDLGELKGTMGSQNYQINGNEIDISKYKSVVIYSEPFNIVFAVANLK